MTAAGTARAFLESPFVETQIRFSPDGRHVAYVTNESDRMDVYAASFPDGTGKARVSLSGGAWPRWRGDGREIFFLSPDGAMMAAAVSIHEGRMVFDTPRPLFKVRLRPVGRLDAYNYDVTRDGQRFLFNSFMEEAASTGLTLVINW